MDSSQSISKDNNKKEFAVDTTNAWENTTYSKMMDEWKGGNEPFVDNLMQEIVQEMAHQKIMADEKESSIMITPERIDTLIQMVEENKDKYEHDDKYVDILKRWKKGDFTTVDDDHNVMIRVQGSKDLGAAIGVASKEQELDYILQVFGEEVEEVLGN